MKVTNKYIKYKMLYFYIKVKKVLSLNDRIIVDPNEKKAKIICFKIINHPDTILLTCNDLLERYVISKKFNCNMIIQLDSIKFYDTQLHYVKFCAWNHNKIVKLFDKKLLEDRLRLKNEFDLAVNDSFDNMYNNIINYE